MYAETKRLLIRDPVLEDWQDTLSFLADQAVMRRIHLGPSVYTEAQARQWVTDLIFYNQQALRNSHNSVIVERTTNCVIGWIGIGKPSDHRLKDGDLDFGYALASSYWGKGYMTEALEAVLGFAFTRLQANRVFAIAEVENKGSWRVMEKTGMTFKKYFAEDHKQMLLYAISKSEWLTNSTKTPEYTLSEL